jgi:PhnB protein
MAAVANPIPDGYHSITPHLISENASRLIEFLKQAFDATEVNRMAGPDGRIMHAELKIGDSMVMIGEAAGEWKAMPASLALYVPNADATYKRALEAGAVSIKEPQDQFYGDRSGAVKDLAGNHWWIATHIEDVPPGELKTRAETWIRQRQSDRRP